MRSDHGTHGSTRTPATEDQDPDRRRVAPLHPVRAVARNYEWVHTGLGLAGNLAFLVGSVFFLREGLKTAGVWLFIVGAIGMLIGSIGRAIIDVHDAHDAD